MIIDFSGIDTSKVKRIKNFMKNLNTTIETIIIRNLNTPKLLTTKYMFRGNKNIKLIDLGDINTNNWSTAYGMFQDCTSLEKVIMRSSSTWRLLDVGEMFNRCEKLTDIDLPAIIPDGSSLISTEYTFSRCSSLEYLDLSTMNIDKYTSTGRMFYKSPKLLKNMDNLRKPSNLLSISLIIAQMLDDDMED